MNKKISLFLYAFLGAVCIVIDRITKYWVVHHDEHSGWVDDSLRPIISCDLVYNRGISWGMLQSESVYQFWAINIFVIAITCFIVKQALIMLAQNRTILGHILVIAGSCSNIIDRFLYKGVVDFIRCGYGNWVFPIFNVADSIIVVGVFIMIITHIQRPYED